MTEISIMGHIVAMIKSTVNKINYLVSKLRTVIVRKKRSPKWDELQREFLKKQPTCQICGTSKKLQVHHKKPFHKFPELELEESNLITLCMGRKECHLRIAHGSSWRYYSDKIEEYAEILNKDISLFKKIAEEAKKNRLK